MSASEHLKQTVGKALGRIPSGVFVLTAAHDSRREAMLASWVQQAGFEPPAVTIAVAKGRPIIDLIKTAKVFALSVAAEADTTLMKRYARGIKPGEDPFEGVETFKTPCGAVAIQSALAWLECTLLQVCDFNGDHDILIAQASDGAILQPGASFTHLRGSGFHY